MAGRSLSWRWVAPVVLLGVIVVAAVVPTPVVALGPGPTFDTLGEARGKPVLITGGLPTFPTTGHLNMTTVGVTEGITTFQALGFWASSEYQILPRSAVYEPGLTEQQTNEQNQAQFDSSVANAEAAALSYLRLPTRISVAALTGASPSTGVLAVGDEILAVANRPVTSPPELLEALGAATPGQPLVLQIRREARPGQVTVVPGADPNNPGRAFLGIRMAIAPQAQERLAITLADVGGPSAGLMFSLGLVDKLTPGALTSGRFVAGTGTITADGAVGEITGIKFKMLRAREVGATVFLVPADNCPEAATEAPAGLQLVRVSTLSEAVSALNTLTGGGSPPGCSS